MPSPGITVKKLAFWCAFSIALFTESVRADVVRLADLENNALRRAPAISAGNARVAQSAARLDGAQDAYHPSFNLDATGSLAPGRTLLKLPYEGDTYYVSGSKAIDQSGAFTPQPRYGVLLGMRDNLYDFGRTRAAVEAATADRVAARADARATDRNIVRQVRAVYWRWAVAHALWLLAKDRALAAEQREQRMQAYIKEGARPQADLTASASQSVQAGIDLERAAADLEAARIDLSYTACRDLGPEAEPEPTFLSSGSEGLPRAAEADPTAEALAAQSAAAKAGARMHERANAPALAAAVNAGVEGRTEQVFPVYAVGLSLSIPLWDGGVASARGAEARAKAAELNALAAARSEAQRHGAARSAAAETRAARRIALAEKWVALGQSRVRELEAGEDLSAEGFATLAAAQADLDRARVELVLAQAARAEARLGLLEP